MSRFSELLRAANNLKLLVAIGRSGGDLGSVADLVDNMLATPQMDACLQRFRAQPGAAAMLEARYPPLQPDLARLASLPEGSLGRCYAELIHRLHYDPAFFRPRPIDTEALWLTQRIATTHDIHHVVCGFGTLPEGETGVLAVTATQIGFPAYVLLTTAAQLSTFRLQPQRFPRMSAAAAHGISLGRQASCLAAVCWEEAWDRPVSEWRAELGILEPADNEPYGLTSA
ncbi:conserved hypothetical protein [Cyanobium sp. PCC 7001]|uniref:Coq4 family protein n=1 Tax=Cyanobium sp. PCC 7001 TaxID=180281 RepID=UPI00018053D7|nr:Coq4 family protein [Cyanobium sp. PCC 7001]EDY38544.1 conserved hypothetical protein [Cyanobium sp. PCC 7001]